MSNIVFVDTHGLTGKGQCYGIGVLVVPEAALRAFAERFYRLTATQAPSADLRWERLRADPGVLNVALDVFRWLVGERHQHSVIVVHKGLYRKWARGDRGEAFYTTFSYLMRNRTALAEGDYRICLDWAARSGRSGDARFRTVTTHMVRQLEADKLLWRPNSRQGRLAFAGLQLVSLVTGAITASHNDYLESKLWLPAARRVLVEHMARIIGWDDLCYDTWPNPHFNIWQFPKQYTGVPGTRPVRPARSKVRPIRPDEVTLPTFAENH